MKKRMFILFLALFIGSQPTIPAQAESMEEVTEEASQETERELTEEEQIIEKLYDGDILETAFIGKSFWYDEENFEGMREDLPQVLADYYQENELDAETLRDLLDTAYESGVSASTLEIAALLFDDDSCLQSQVRTDMKISQHKLLPFYIMMYLFFSFFS